MAALATAIFSRLTRKLSICQASRSSTAARAATAACSRAFVRRRYHGCMAAGYAQSQPRPLRGLPGAYAMRAAPAFGAETGALAALFGSQSRSHHLISFARSASQLTGAVRAISNNEDIMLPDTKLRAETGVRNPRPRDDNARNCWPETAPSELNPRECQRFPVLGAATAFKRNFEARFASGFPLLPDAKQ
jgi:hypothetical protein